MVDDLIDIMELVEAAARDLGGASAGLALITRTPELPFVLADALRLRTEVRATLRWLTTGIQSSVAAPSKEGASTVPPVSASNAACAATKAITLFGAIEPARPGWLRVELARGARSHRLMLPLAGAVSLTHVPDARIAL